MKWRWLSMHIWMHSLYNGKLRFAMSADIKLFVYVFKRHITRSIPKFYIVLRQINFYPHILICLFRMTMHEVNCYHFKSIVNLVITFRTLIRFQEVILCVTIWHQHAYINGKHRVSHELELVVNVIIIIRSTFQLIKFNWYDGCCLGG